MRRRDWNNLTELADKMEADASAGKRVVLSATTAWIVAAKLRAVDRLPTRNEIAQHLCKSKGYTCAANCYACTGWANIVVAAYGCSFEPLGVETTESETQRAPRPAEAERGALGK